MAAPTAVFFRLPHALVHDDGREFKGEFAARMAASVAHAIVAAHKALAQPLGDAAAFDAPAVAAQAVAAASRRNEAVAAIQGRAAAANRTHTARRGARRRARRTATTMSATSA